MQTDLDYILSEASKSFSGRNLVSYVWEPVHMVIRTLTLSKSLPGYHLGSLILKNKNSIWCYFSEFLEIGPGHHLNFYKTFLWGLER
jgi:hypothetical protein